MLLLGWAPKVTAELSNKANNITKRCAKQKEVQHSCLVPGKWMTCEALTIVGSGRNPSSMFHLCPYLQSKPIFLCQFTRIHGIFYSGFSIYINNAIQGHLQGEEIQNIRTKTGPKMSQIKQCYDRRSNLQHSEG